MMVLVPWKPKNLKQIVSTELQQYTGLKNCRTLAEVSQLGRGLSHLKIEITTHALDMVPDIMFVGQTLFRKMSKITVRWIEIDKKFYNERFVSEMAVGAV